MLKYDKALGAGLDEIADDAAREAGGTVEKQVTSKRQVRLVRITAESQAVDGAGTKAISRVAAARSGRGFVSRRQWRRAFAIGLSSASDIARDTSGGYEGLPEKASG